MTSTETTLVTEIALPWRHPFGLVTAVEYPADRPRVVDLVLANGNRTAETRTARYALGAGGVWDLAPKCAWCGEPADDELGGLNYGYHDVCAESRTSGALAQRKMARHLDGVENADREEHTAWGRAETEPCERGTVGCSVRHDAAALDLDCEVW